MDTRWYLELNRLSRATHWAHGVATSYYERVGAPLGAAVLVLAGITLLAALLPDRCPYPRWATFATGMAGAGAAYGVAIVVAQALAQRPPSAALHHVLLLLPGPRSDAFPDPRLAACGALTGALAINQRWSWALLALLVTALDAVAGVYVGADYPSDVAGGAVLGAAVAALLCLVFDRLAELYAPAPVRRQLAFAPRGRRRLAPRRRLSAMPGPSSPTSRAMEALRSATEAGRAQRTDGATSGTGPAEVRQRVEQGRPGRS